MIADEPMSPEAPAAGLTRLPSLLNVNDDDANRFALTRTLSRAGYQIQEASSGTEALHRVTESPPDLVILDVDLPDIDGFEVCRRIKADPRTAAIPVLHLTARFVSEEDRLHGFRSGADGYLIMPVEPPELISSIRGLLRMSRAEDAARQGALRIVQLEKEIGDLERLTAAVPPAAASRDPETQPLRARQPAAFAEMVTCCEQLLELALKHQNYKVDNENSDMLRQMGERLGALGAGPRDVVDVYGTALKALSSGSIAARSRAYVDEGRLLVLELMGYLVTYYRDRTP